jgi:osmotically inducible lipoprotein OsmB
MTNNGVKVAALVTGLALLTAACGDRPVDRALTGGAIGAASGAVVGAAGATIGAVTAPER